MAIKTRTSRDTYRSNVKKRPLRQNGLEAQYQGLDVTEVNIDHAGLAMIGRGGHQTRRNIRKVRKQYIVDVPAEEHNPTAELIFTLSNGAPPLDRTTWPYDQVNNVAGKSLQYLAGDYANSVDGEAFRVTDQSGAYVDFEYSNDPSYESGDALANGKIAISIISNEYSFKLLLEETRDVIQSKFPQGTFRFELYVQGSEEMIFGQTEPQVVAEDKIKIILVSPVKGSASLSTTSSYFDVATNTFDDQSESHEWRLNGFIKDSSDEMIFYEDIRTDAIQSTNPHSLRNPNMLFRSEQFDTTNPNENRKNFYDKEIVNIAGDPTDAVNYPRFTTHDSEEVLIRQYPRREEIFDTYRSNFQWREDIHYLSPDQQTWTLMSALATNYHSSLEAHITAMMNSNFADEQYIDPYPLSGRVDVFNRLSRIFDTHVDLIFERHPYSVFDQFLDPVDDFINLKENRYPKRDDLNSDVAFEDMKGTLEPKQVRLATTSSFEYIHTGVGSDFTNNFTVYLPDENNKFTVTFGDGTSHITTWNTTANLATGPLIRIVTHGVNPIAPNPTDIVPIIVAAFEDLRSNPINGFDFSGYTITQDLTGPHPKFTIEGLGYSNRIELRDHPNFDGGPDNQITVNTGIDRLQHGGEIPEDYFDQPPLDNHDYVETERWSRIDSEMLDILTFNANRETHIDTREWQYSEYIHTATGFINSQQSGQDGIIYREMMR